MIPFDFDYYRPVTVADAVRLYRDLERDDRQPLYYGGGTEIITMARFDNIVFGAVIDLKGIPECNELGFDGDTLIIGAAVSLGRIGESKLFPLLGLAGGRVADHTTQGKITLGGNICGTIIYHEALLPLLLADSEAVVAGPDGLRQIPLSAIFHERPRLNKGEFIVRLVTAREYSTAPHAHVKRTKSEKIDYPLISLAALQHAGRLRLACSGVCAYPFRSEQLEDDLNDQALSSAARVDNALSHLPGPLLHDIAGSAGYRRFVLGRTLLGLLENGVG
jgi:CO/xanthine dehydrogenase FAD-binding subunit